MAFLHVNWSNVKRFGEIYRNIRFFRIRSQASHGVLGVYGKWKWCSILEKCSKLFGWKWCGSYKYQYYSHWGSIEGMNTLVQNTLRLDQCMSLTAK